MVWLAVSTYLVIGLYLLNVTYSKPVLSMDVQNEDGQWILIEPYYKEWAEKHKIKKGDIILEVDGKQIDSLRDLKYEPVIRAARELKIMKDNGAVINLNIKLYDIPEQFFYVLIVPFVTSFLHYLSLYIYIINKKYNSLKFIDSFYLNCFLSLC